VIENKKLMLAERVARYMLDTDTCSYIMKRSSQMVLT